MKRIALFLFLILSAITCIAQTQIDPTYQIAWNLLTGSGAPSISCTQNGNYTVYPYGAEWGQSYQDTTNNVRYNCTSTGWMQGAASSGIVPIVDGGTGATTASGALANLGGAALTGATFTGPVSGTSASFSGTLAVETSIQLGISTFAQLQSAVTSCGSLTCSIFVTANILVPSNYLIPANVVTNFAGGQLQPSSGMTLTISGPIGAPRMQIFGGAGAVAGLSIARPEWFGSTGTVSLAASSLAAGGQVLLDNAIYQSGSTASPITASNISIVGVGQAIYNGTNTAFVTGTGTIIQHNLWLNASNLTIRNISIDVGSAVGACNNGLSVTPGSYASPLTDITIDHVSTLLCNATSAYHSVLVENVQRAAVSNIQTRFGVYGLVLKCQNCSVDHIVSSGHSSNCGIVKSDANYGISKGIDLHDLKCVNIAVGDTGPWVFDGYGAAVSMINVNGLQATGTAGGLEIDARTDGTNTGTSADIGVNNLVCSGNSAPCLYVLSADVSDYVDRVNASNIVANTTTDAILLSNDSGHVNLSNINVTGTAAGGHGIDNAADKTLVSGMHCSGTIAGYCIFANMNHMFVSGLNGTGALGQVGTNVGVVAYLQQSNKGTQSTESVTANSLSSADTSSAVGDLVEISSNGNFADSGITASYPAGVAFSFSNGWNNYGGSQQPATYRTDRSVVRLTGLIVPGTTTTVATLPSAYWPRYTLHFIADCNATAMAEVVISTAGVITAPTTCSSYVSLDGISYPLQ